MPRLALSTRLTVAASLALLAATSAALAGPGVVGNGGDAVRCTETAGSSFKGLYSLDYLLTFETQNSDADIVPVFSWDESYQRLSRALAAADGDLSSSFEDFVGGMDNFSDWTQPKIWREASFGLVQINDQSIIRKLPSNCYTAGADGSINITQTVVQTQRPGQIEYDYDPTVYNEFKAYAPVQFSFLMVHEWLRELTGDVQVIRNVDFLLHAKDATVLAPPAFQLAVANIGLNLEPAAYKSICDRNAVLRDQIVAAVRKPCDQINANDLRTADSSRLGVLFLTLNSAPIGPLTYDDFGGLVSLRTLTLHDVGLTHLFSHALDQAMALNKLDLSNNHLKDIGGQVFTGKTVLMDVNLSGNELSAIPVELYQLMTKYDSFDKINLSKNHIKSLPSFSGITIPPPPSPDTATCLDLGMQPSIDLSDNQLTDAPPELCQLAICGGTVNLRGNPLTAAAKAALAAGCTSGNLLVDP